MKRLYSLIILGLIFLCVPALISAQDCSLQCVDNFTVVLLPLPLGCCGSYLTAQELAIPPEEGCPSSTALSIYRVADIAAAGPDFEPVAGQDSLFLTVDDDESTIVRVFAFAEDGSYQFCDVYLLVQEHSACECAPDFCVQPQCPGNLVVNLDYDLATGNCSHVLDVTDIAGEALVQACEPWAFYSIYREEEVEEAGPDFVPQPGQSSILFTDFGIKDIRLYAIDYSGDYGYCQVQVFILPGPLCYDSGDVPLWGLVATEDDEPIAGVEVRLFHQSFGNVVHTTLTDGSYSFIFEHNDPDTSLLIEPSKDDNLLNGVTTFDIVLIAKHILGTQPFENPYQMLAADVNRSGSISTLDLIFMRKAILNVNDFFPNNTSWRFVPEDYTFPDPQNPWLEEVPGTVTLNLDPNNSLNLDFVGIKVGDVNGSAAAN